MKVKIVNNSTNPLPEYAYDGDSGMDLRAELSLVNEKFLFNTVYENNTITIYPGGRALIPTGIKTSFPKGYEVQIRSRSGLALKNGIFVLNSPGTIDSNFRNFYGVILFNANDEPFIVHQGDKIAQMVLTKVETITWDEVESLEETDRNLGGFGSSGVK